MADDIDRIEKEIAQARDDLANTLDQLADRANPERIVNDVKTKALALLSTPAVKATLAGVGTIVVVIVVRKIVTR